MKVYVTKYDVHSDRATLLGTCADLTAAGRQMMQNTGGNWFGMVWVRFDITNQADLRPV